MLLIALGPSRKGGDIATVSLAYPGHRTALGCQSTLQLSKPFVFTLRRG